MKIYGPQVAQDTEIKNPVIETGTTFPLSPAEGTLFFLTTGIKGMYVFDGIGWSQSSNVNINQVISKQNAEVDGIIAGTLVYNFNGTQMKRAKANSDLTKTVLGIVINSLISPDSSGLVQTEGIVSLITTEWDAVTGDVGGLSPGAVYFLSDTDDGFLTLNAPDITNRYVCRVGMAINSTDLLVNIEPPIKL